MAGCKQANCIGGVPMASYFNHASWCREEIWFLPEDHHAAPLNRHQNAIKQIISVSEAAFKTLIWVYQTGRTSKYRFMHRHFSSRHYRHHIDLLSVSFRWAAAAAAAAASSTGGGWWVDNGGRVGVPYWQLNAMVKWLVFIETGFSRRARFISGLFW